MIKLLGAAFGAFLLIVTGAIAADPAPLTDEEVTRFIATLDDVKALSDEMGPDVEIFVEPTAGDEFRPCTDTVEGLRAKYPEGYARLQAIAQAEGFSAEQWGATGDRVMRAYIVEKSEQKNPGAAAKAAEGAKKMAAMDPAMLAMLPPNARAEMEAGAAMAKFFEETPTGDRDAVRPHLAALDALFDAE